VENIERLEAVYPHHTDIDLIIGGLAERPLSGTLKGMSHENVDMQIVSFFNEEHDIIFVRLSE